ncbi:MAG: hypothetical protein GY896_22840 [Gammaproteobacteria bacterium]|nr:hypothetical protein [Gammaproteobacteria bacterium]
MPRKKKTLREIAATTPKDEKLEKSIVKACLDYLNSLPSSEFQKRHGSRTRSGDPDITGCLNGMHWEIEIKRPGKKPTDRQYSRLRTWSKAGAIAIWVTSLEGLREFMQKYEGYCHEAIREYAHSMLQ